jgi:hypothetical protein
MYKLLQWTKHSIQPGFILTLRALALEDDDRSSGQILDGEMAFAR